MVKKKKIKPYILLLDPAIMRPEVSSLKLIKKLTKYEVFYHLPAMSHMGPITHLSPRDEALRGIVILGSAANMNERHGWKNGFMKWIETFLDAKIPTLGICFGHQMIAAMMGARVNYAFKDKKKHCGFREVQLEPDSLWGNKKISGQLLVSHCQVVRDVPRDMKVIAHSSAVEIEGLKHKTLPIWTFQPHPEATPEFAEFRNIPVPKNPKAFHLGQSIVKTFLDEC